MAARNTLAEVKKMIYGFEPIGMFSVPGASFMQLAQYDSVLVREKRAFEQLERSKFAQSVATSQVFGKMASIHGITLEQLFQKFQQDGGQIVSMLQGLDNDEIEIVRASFDQLQDRLNRLNIIINNRAQVLAGYEVQRISEKKERLTAEQDEALQSGAIDAAGYQATLATFNKKYDEYFSKVTGLQPATWVQAEGWETEDLMDFPNAVLTEIELFFQKEVGGGKLPEEVTEKKEIDLTPAPPSPPTGMPSDIEYKRVAS